MQRFYELDFATLCVSITPDISGELSIKIRLVGNQTDLQTPFLAKTDRVKIRSCPNVIASLDCYFSGKPIDHVGEFTRIKSNPSKFGVFSDFASKCYLELCRTNCGSLKTYKQLANKMNSRAYQAVGGALRRNRFPVLLPCHRIVGKSGLGGFMGKRSKLKGIDFLSKSEIEELLARQDIAEEIKVKVALIHHERLMAD